MSLTCICCKNLELIKVGNINKRLALESILADCQHGFRSQRSCEPQLVQFYHKMVSNLDRHKQTDVIIMDFAKAFDKVPHKRLIPRPALTYRAAIGPPFQLQRPTGGSRHRTAGGDATREMMGPMSACRYVCCFVAGIEPTCNIIKFSILMIVVNV